MSHRPNVLLAFDFGLARIGIASGNHLTGTATPLTTLDSRGGPPWEAIDSVVKDWGPDELVVGMPSNDSDNPIVQRIRGFVTTLSGRYDLPVGTVDESNTSVEATARLREQRATGERRRRVRKELIDSHAASLIAIRWMQRDADAEETDAT